MRPPTSTDKSSDTRLSLIEDRLAQGGQAFAELRQGQNRLRWFGVGLIATALGIAFSAGQFVSGVEETRKAQRDAAAQMEQVKASVTTIERDQVRIRASIDAVEAGQARIEKKLESDADARPRRKR